MFAYTKSLHPKKQEGAEHSEDNSSPHRNFEQYVECKGSTQHCSRYIICCSNVKLSKEKKYKMEVTNKVY